MLGCKGKIVADWLNALSKLVGCELKTCTGHCSLFELILYSCCQSRQYRLIQCHLYCLQGECDPALGGEFVFTVHAKELVIGEIFVRIYNEQPTFTLEVGTCLSLLGFMCFFLLKVL